MNFLRNQLLIYWSAPIQTILILIEILISKKLGKKAYTIRDTLTNLYLMCLALTIDYGMLFFVTIPTLNFFNEYAFFSIQTSWVYWLVLLIFEDFMFYWEHRFDHQFRVLWAVHATHHSSDMYNLTVGFRSSVFQGLYRFIYFIPIAICGFKPLDIIFLFSITQIYGILIHTQLINKLGFLETFMATPSHHRVHHASNVAYLDKNMGMVFIIWDKLFGTFEEERDEQSYQKIEYGLTKKLKDIGPTNIVLHEWKAIAQEFKREIPFLTKLKYLFMPPGWSHDGSTHTSKQLQKNEN